jgi:nucleoside-diphosphate-sugar epimerase
MTRFLLLGADGHLGYQIRRAVLESGRGSYLAAVSGHAWLAPEPTTGDWHRVDLVRASVSDVTLLLDFTQPDVVINCTGCAAGPVDRLEAVNVSVVAKLLAALRRFGSSGSSALIHLGSAAEYGWQPPGLAIPESATPRPSGDYGRTKLMATDLITKAAARGDVRATVLRVFDPIGPGAPVHTVAGTALREIRRAMATGAMVVVLGQLRAYRDFLASVDVAAAVLRLADSTGVPSILNVGRGVPTSVRSMVELLAGAAGFDGDILESGEHRPPPAAIWQQADLTLLRHHLHWVPTTSVAEAVRALWWQSAGRPTVDGVGGTGVVRPLLSSVGPRPGRPTAAGRGTKATRR